MQLCGVPLMLACLSGLGLNTAMISYICKKRGLKRSSCFTFASVGLFNAAFSISLIFRGISLRVSQLKSKQVETVAVCLYLTCSLSQLLGNVALACERYQAIVTPFKHSASSALKRVQIGLLIGIIACIACGCAVGLSSVIYHREDIVFYLIQISRLFAIVLLAILYFKIFRSFKNNRVNLQETTCSENSAAQNEAEETRVKKERKLLKMCLGITISFATLNLPVTLYNAFEATGHDCNTRKGKILAAFFFLLILNIVFDPLWYFYMEKRKD